MVDSITDQEALDYLREIKERKQQTPVTPMGVHPKVAHSTGTWGANAAAEKLAAAILAKGGRVSMDQVESVMCSFENWPVQERPNVAPELQQEMTVPGFLLGVSIPRMTDPRVSRATTEYPQTSKLLVKFAKDHLPKAFLFSSIQVNYNYESKWHVDANNVGPSYIIGVGDYEGGELEIDDGGKFSVLDCNKKWVPFDGNISHHTLPITNPNSTRVTIIYFTNHRYNDIPRPAATALRKLGYEARSDGKDSSEEFRLRRELKVEAVQQTLANRSAEEGKRRREAHASFAAFIAGVKRPELKAKKNEIAVHIEAAGYGISASGHIYIGTTVGATEPIVTSNTGMRLLVISEGTNGPEQTLHKLDLYKHSTKEGQDAVVKILKSIPRTSVVVGACGDAWFKASGLPSEKVLKAFAEFGGELALGYREPCIFLGSKAAPEQFQVVKAGKNEKSLLEGTGGIVLGPRIAINCILRARVVEDLVLATGGANYMSMPMGATVAERALLSRKRQEESHRRRAIDAAKVVLAGLRDKEGGKRCGGPRAGQRSAKRAKTGDKENANGGGVANRKCV